MDKTSTKEINISSSVKKVIAPGFRVACMPQSIGLLSSPAAIISTTQLIFRCTCLFINTEHNLAHIGKYVSFRTKLNAKT